jgi:hypothetical protein
MLATQDMLDAQAARMEAQAAREREWRNEDLERARQQRNEDIDLLKASMRISVWVPVISVVIGALLAAWLAWLLGPRNGSAATTGHAHIQRQYHALGRSGASVRGSVDTGDPERACPAYDSSMFSEEASVYCQ